MPQLDISTFPSQIFWLIITFSALFFVVWRISVPKIADTLEARQKRIDDNLVRAEELKKDAESALRAYEVSLEQAHLEAQNILTEANAKLARESQLQEDKLNEILESRFRESEKNIDRAIKDATVHIRDAAMEVAATAFERLAGERPNLDDAGTAVDTALNIRN